MSASDTFRNLAPAKQERIMQEALWEFSQNGYAQGSLNSLVQRLGISKGSIYQYFGDKAGLFREVFKYSTRETLDRLNDLRQRSQGQDVYERLREMIMVGLQLQNENARHLNIYLRIVYEEDIPGREDLLRDFHLFFRDFLMELLAQGRLAGQVADDIDLEMASLATLAVVERFLVARAVKFKDMETGIHTASVAELSLLVDRAMAVLKNGIGAKDLPGRRPSPHATEVNVYSSEDEDLNIATSQTGDGQPGGASPTFHHLPAAKREHIMREAVSMFAEQGYGKASLNSLVSKIGISKGSIFNYFHHKANLFYTVFSYVLGKAVGPMRRLLEESRGQDLFTRLYLTVLAGFDLCLNKPRYFNLYLRIIHDTDLPMRDLMLQTLTRFSNRYMATLFQEAREAGEVDEDLDVEMASLVAMAVVERLLVAYGVAHKDLAIGLYRADLEQAGSIAFGVIDCLRQGLGPRP